MGAGTHLNARERGFTPAATPAINPSLSFVENIGQVHNQHQQPRPDIDFRLSAGKGLSVFIGSGQIHYQWAKSVKGGPDLLLRTDGQGLGDGSRQDGPDTPVFKMYRMDMVLLGASPHARAVTEEKAGFYERYYLPGVATQGAVARAYRKITYRDVYPHIDWVIYCKGNTLEYDFVVRPGGKVSDIRLQYGGATKLALQADGSLLAVTPMGKVREQAPRSYDAQGRVVASAFQLEGNTLSFSTSPYSGTLTIDPAVEWGTYFGGSDEEMGRGITPDTKGNVYLAGTTGSLSNIATTGAYQATYGGGSNPNGADAFLSKWDADGNLLWATYYGGTKLDIAYSVACDTADNVYMGGYTKSDSGIATAGSYQDTKAGTAARSDAFLVKFDTSGQRIWSTYFGGTQNEASKCLALTSDKAGHIYMTGDTRSSGDIATAGAYQSAIAGYYDVFLAKFDTDGNLDWSTYYGGEEGDYSLGISADTSGNAYIAGYTLSTTGIATAGAYQGTKDVIEDAFVAKFSPNGNLDWGTYQGGDNFDGATSLSVSGSGIVYVGGQTMSATGIATANGFQDSLSGTDDGFLSAFDTSGQLLWATYLGGAGSDPLRSVWANDLGKVYVSGETSSDSGIATPNGINAVYAGSYDAFLVKFDSTGQRLQGSYFGGGSSEVNGIMSGSANFIYLSGYTFSGTSIATPNAYQSTLNGSGMQDAFLIKINDCEAPAIPAAILGDTAICSGTTHTYAVMPVPGASSYTFILPPGWNGQAAGSPDSIYVTPGDTSGILEVVAISACGGGSDTQSLQVTVLPTPGPQLVNSNGVLSTTQSYATYQWLLNGTAIPGANTPTYLPDENGDYSVRVTNSAGCEGLSDTLSLSGLGIVAAGQKTLPDVYPNPAEDYVIIRSPINAAAALWSVDGRLVMDNIALHEGDNRVALEDLSAGMYWLKIVTDKRVRVIRLSVKR